MATTTEHDNFMTQYYRIEHKKSRPAIRIYISIVVVAWCRRKVWEFDVVLMGCAKTRMKKPRLGKAGFAAMKKPRSGKVGEPQGINKPRLSHLHF